MSTKSLHDYLTEINGLLDRNDTREALAHCRHILQRFPRHVATYRAMAQALLDQGEFPDAIDLFHRVLSTDPGDFVAHLGLAVIYEEQDSLPQSIWHMERAFEMKPYDPVIQNKLRDLLIKREPSVPPRITLTQGALARIYLRGELYQQAALELRKALSEEEDRIDLEVLLAETLWRDGKRVEAVELCRSILARLPNCIQANAILAEVWFQTGRNEEAHEHLKRIQDMIQLDAGHFDIETAVGRAFTANGTHLLPDQVEVEYLGDAYESAAAMTGATEWGAESTFPEEDLEGTFSWLREDVFGEEGDELEELAEGSPAAGAPSTESIWLVDDAAEESGEELADVGEVPDWLSETADSAAEQELAEASMVESTWFAASEADLVSDDSTTSADDSDWLSLLGLPDEETGQPFDELELVDFAAEEGAEELPWLLVDDDSPDEAASEGAEEGAVYEGDSSFEVPSEALAEGQPYQEEIPEWLSSGGLDVEVEGEPIESSAELGDRLDFPYDDAADGDEHLPDWLASEVREATGEARSEEMPESPSDLTERAMPPTAEEPSDWLDEGGAADQIDSEKIEGASGYPEMPSLGPSQGDDLPDWLRDEEYDTRDGIDAVDEAFDSLGIESEQLSKDEADLPDWLREAGDAGEQAEVEESEPVEVSSELPEEAESESEEYPTWLQEEQYDTLVGLKVVDDAGESVGLTTQMFLQDEDEISDQISEQGEPEMPAGAEVKEALDEISELPGADESEDEDLPDWLQEGQFDTLVGLKAVDDAGESVGLTTQIFSQDEPDQQEPLSEQEQPETMTAPETSPEADDDLEAAGVGVTEGDDEVGIPSVGVAEDEDLPDWLQQEHYDTAAGIEVVEQAVESLGLSTEILSQGEADIPQWLREADEAYEQTPDEEPEASDDDDEIPSTGVDDDEEIPSWLKDGRFGTDEAIEVADRAQESLGLSTGLLSEGEADIPEWLREEYKAEDRAGDEEPKLPEDDDIPSTGVEEEEEIPAWLKEDSFGTDDGIEVVDQAEESLGLSKEPLPRDEADVPEWLQAVDDRAEITEAAESDIDGLEDTADLSAAEALLAEADVAESSDEYDVMEPDVPDEADAADALADLPWLTEQPEPEEAPQQEMEVASPADESDEVTEDSFEEVAETTGWLETLTGELAEEERPTPEPGDEMTSEIDSDAAEPAIEPEPEMAGRAAEIAAMEELEPEELTYEPDEDWDELATGDVEYIDWMSELADEDEEPEELPETEEELGLDDDTGLDAELDTVLGVDVEVEMAAGLEEETSSGETHDEEMDVLPDSDEDIEWLAELADQDETEPDDLADIEEASALEEAPEEGLEAPMEAPAEPEAEVLLPGPADELDVGPEEADQDMEWLAEPADQDELEPEDLPDIEETPALEEEPEEEAEAISGPVVESAAVSEPEVEESRPEPTDELEVEPEEADEDIEWLAELAEQDELEPEDLSDIVETPAPEEEPEVEPEAALEALAEPELEVSLPEPTDELDVEHAEADEDVDWMAELAGQDESEQEEPLDIEELLSLDTEEEPELDAEPAMITELDLEVPAIGPSGTSFEGGPEAEDEVGPAEELPRDEETVEPEPEAEMEVAADAEPILAPEMEVPSSEPITDVPDVPEDLDDAMAWLEQLAADQGAPVEELPTVAEVTEPREEDLLAAAIEADVDESADSVEMAAETGAEVSEAPEELDDAMAWLEALAVRQGAPVEELPSVREAGETTADEAVDLPEETKLSDELAKALDWLEQTAFEAELPIADEAGDEPAIEVVDDDLKEALDQLEQLAVTGELTAADEEISAVGEAFEDEIALGEDETLETFIEVEDDVAEAVGDEQEELEDSWQWLEESEAEDAVDVGAMEPTDDTIASEAEPEPSAPVADLPVEEQEHLPDELEIQPTFGADDDALFTPSVDLAEGVLEDGFLDDVPDDPEAALAWLEQFVEGEEGAEEPADAVEELTEATAFDDLSLPEESARPDVGRLTSDLLEEFGNELDAEFLEQIPDDPDQAIAWLQQFVDDEISPADEDGEDDAALMAKAEAAAMVELDYEEEMLDAAVDQLGDDTDGDDLLDEMPDDPDAAMAWLQDLAEQQAVTTDELLLSVTDDAEELLEEALSAPPSEDDEFLGEEVFDIEDLSREEGGASAEEIAEQLEEESPDELPEWLMLESVDRDEADEDDEWLGLAPEPDVAGWLEAEEEATVAAVSDADSRIARAEDEFGTGPLDETKLEIEEDTLRLPDTDRLAHSVIDLDESQLTLARQTLRVRDYTEAILSYQSLVEEGEGLSTLISDLETASEEHTGQPLIRRLLGDAYMRNGQLQKALDNYRMALDLL